MSLDGNARAQAIYGPLKAKNDALRQQGKPSMSDADLQTLLSGLQQTYAADTSYLQGAAEIAPGSLAAQAGIPVTTPTGPGSTSAPGPLDTTGRGKLL